MGHVNRLIISINKTKIKDKPLTSISLPGYIVLHNNSVSSSGGTGVATFRLNQRFPTFLVPFPIDSICQSAVIQASVSEQYPQNDFDL